MVRSNADEKVGGDATPSTPQNPPEATFETALAELEQIVQKMESGSLTLEESISAYQRGSVLLKHCQNQLGEAEDKIRLLENGVLRDFDPARGES
ncbi:MAG: exodeoxyribonuclease VII small subunit [Propionivibrio sp.]